MVARGQLGCLSFCETTLLFETGHLGLVDGAGLAGWTENLRGLLVSSTGAMSRLHPTVTPVLMVDCQAHYQLRHHSHEVTLVL